MRKKDLVTYELDLKRPASFTATQAAELAALVASSEEQVDTSDIAALPESFWTNAIRNPLNKPLKQQVTVRVDADVLAWLRSSGREY